MGDSACYTHCTSKCGDCDHGIPKLGLVHKASITEPLIKGAKNTKHRLLFSLLLDPYTECHTRKKGDKRLFISLVPKVL